MAEMKIESYGIKLELRADETSSLINRWKDQDNDIQATMGLLERYGIHDPFRDEDRKIMLSLIASWIVLNEQLIIHANRNERGVILTIPWGSLPSLPMSL
jgi:hypothetical protein